MKKISLIVLVLLMTVILSCSKKENKITIAATATPHAEILEFLKPKLKEKGFDLEIMVVSDVVIGNNALKEGSVDANYLQHRGTLARYNEDQKANFVEAVGVHLEPFGMYSTKIKDVKDLPQNAEIIVPNTAANQGRSLKLLSDAGVLKFKDGVKVEVTSLQEFDKNILENPKNLKFKQVQPSLLPQLYTSGEGDAIFINANYALQAKLNPLKDSILVENVEKSERFVNLLVVKSGDETKEGIKALVELLKSKETSDFIKEKYNDKVIPAN
ncbi:MAG: methionine ABC transporter substrate-binding protein [Leptotrichiaceae bacterium]|nr:methionine ABC transporter substrate-binding protein [Leptotrichiaceae bacterium]MBP6280645.1 methionine ABC transporter substrate-binding protein [Leptotrichiaceae bacterium]MBP7100088.1 methionine ABC transporter substrate-binding protein [Leptotrichiaceae bacterium]MBP7725144.1 methionine ABC transporter substrate-binding protein [Leptotrichiaceae bacterium]MBP9629173.1 methionine ABC transporter substrate-binding protein [Leptotrichiaceae bacterium]